MASLLEMPAEVALPEEVDIENLLSGQGKDNGEVLLAVAEREIRLQLRLVAKMEGRLQSVLGHVSRAREQIAARSAVEDEGSGAKEKGKGKEKEKGKGKKGGKRGRDEDGEEGEGGGNRRSRRRK